MKKFAVITLTFIALGCSTPKQEVKEIADTVQVVLDPVKTDTAKVVTDTIK